MLHVISICLVLADSNKKHVFASVAPAILETQEISGELNHCSPVSSLPTLDGYMRILFPWCKGQPEQPTKQLLTSNELVIVIQAPHLNMIRLDAHLAAKRPKNVQRIQNISNFRNVLSVFQGGCT